MYVRPISALFLGGKSTPAIRAIIASLLSLPLLMLRVGADHANDTFAMNDLALVANFLNRCSYFHGFLNNFVMRPLV